MSLRADAPVFLPSNIPPLAHSSVGTRESFDSGGSSTLQVTRKRNKQQRKRRNRKEKTKADKEKDTSKNNTNDSDTGRAGTNATENKKNNRKQHHRNNRKRRDKIDKQSTSTTQSVDGCHVKDKKDTALSFAEFRSLFPPLDVRESFTKSSHNRTTETSDEGKWSSVAWQAHEKEKEQQENERLEQIEQKERGNVVLTTLSARAAAQDRPPIVAEPLETKNETCSSVGDIQQLSVSSCYTQSASWDMAKLRNRWWQIIREKKQQQREQRLHEEDSPWESSDDSSSGSTASSDASIDTDTDESDKAHRGISVTAKADVVMDNDYLQHPYPLHLAVINDDSVALSQLLDVYRNEHGDNIGQNQPVKLKELGLSEVHGFCAMKKLSPVGLAICLDRPHLLRMLWLNDNFERKNRYTKTSREQSHDETSTTPLMLACQLGRDGCIKILLSHGGSKNQINSLAVRDRTSGNTALHYICSVGAPTSTLALLLGNGMRSKSSSRVQQQKLVTAKNYKGQTPLHLACQGGHEHLVQALLHGCSSSLMSKVFRIQDDLGRTPLLAAIGAEHSNVVMSLLMWRGNHYHHAEQVIAQQSKATAMHCPLTWAASRGSLYMVSLLLEFNDPTTASGGMYQYDLTRAIHAAVRTAHCNNRTEMVRVLIEAGANPFLGKDENTREITAGQESAVSVIACQNEGDANSVLVTMLDTFARVHAASSTRRRQDPILRRQPESYFRGIEQKEARVVKAGLSEALVKSLFHGWALMDNDAKTRCLQSSIILMKRGAHLSQADYPRLKSSLVANRLLPTHEGSPPDVFLYEASCPRYCNSNVGQKVNISKYDRSAVGFWSDALCEMPWMSRESDIECRRIRSQLRQQRNRTAGSVAPDAVLVADGEEFHVHRDLLSLQSEKLAAAFRFAFMKNMDKDNDEPVKVETGLSPKMCKILLQHIYHGSIVSGWDGDGPTSCLQLLEIAVLAEEFLCPSLVRECEMRLLASKPFACFCWSCCKSVTACDTGAMGTPRMVANSIYQVKGPSRLISPKVVLDVVAVAQQLCTSFLRKSYSIRYIPLNKVPSDVQLPLLSDTEWSEAKSFESVKEAAMQVMLREFPAVLESEPYAAHIRETIDIAAEESNSSEAATTLLHMCLEELACCSLSRASSDGKNKPRTGVAAPRHYDAKS